MQFENSKDFSEWFDARRHKVGSYNLSKEVLALSSRAALRSLPFIGYEFLRAGTNLKNNSILSVFRMLSVSWIASEYNEENFQDYAESAVTAHVAVRRSIQGKSFKEFLSKRAIDAAFLSASVVCDDKSLIINRAISTILASAGAVDKTTESSETIENDLFGGVYIYTSRPAIQQFSSDAEYLQSGGMVSQLMHKPLWNSAGLPSESERLWQSTKRRLLNYNEGWDVWIEWYENRMNGLSPATFEEEKCYVMIADNIWNTKRPGYINSYIKNNINAANHFDFYFDSTEEYESHEEESEDVYNNEFKTETDVNSQNTKDQDTLQGLKGIEAPVAFGWKKDGTISVINGTLPKIDIAYQESDFRGRLAAVNKLTQKILHSMTSNRYNCRAEYITMLESYLETMINNDENRDFYIADAYIRAIRAMFQADSDFLEIGLASMLKVLIEQHIGLRAYYPQITAFYEDVRTGRLNKPRSPWMQSQVLELQ